MLEADKKYNLEGVSITNIFCLVQFVSFIDNFNRLFIIVVYFNQHKGALYCKHCLKSPYSMFVACFCKILRQNYEKLGKAMHFWGLFPNAGLTQLISPVKSVVDQHLGISPKNGVCLIFLNFCI